MLHFAPFLEAENCHPFKSAIDTFDLINLIDLMFFFNFFGDVDLLFGGVFFQKDSVLYWEPPLFRAGKCKNPNADGTSSFQYLADYSNVINDHKVRTLF